MPVKPLGGTQIIDNYLHEHLDLDGFHIWPTTFDGKEIDPSVINIYHQHLEASLGDMANIFTEERISMMDAVVFVRYWQCEDFLITFPEICKRLDLDEIELYIYFSLEIYGKDCEDKVKGAYGSKYDDLFKELDSIPGINYKGYVTNEEVKQACLDAHTYLYPAIIMETSCLSLMEAMAGGCASIYTNLGALPETGSEYGYPSLMSFNDDQLIDNFVKKTNFVCDNYWTQPVQEKLKRQRSFYREHYSWEVRLKEWEALLKDLKKLKE